MTDPKRTQGSPEKGGRQTGQQGVEREEKKPGERNPEPHEQGGGTGKESRGV